jgi:rSAM/selenodomain-associated transferase 1
MAKQPLAGLVKTRLAAETSTEFAAQVAGALLSDSLDRFAGIDARRILAFTPQAAKSFFSNLARGRFELTAQAHGDLGQRMAAFFREQSQLGAEKTILIGVDSPTLPLSYVEEGFAKLDRADLVLGPATDGGYYLVGCSTGRISNPSCCLPPIFENMSWSAPNVLQDTVSRLQGTECRLELLPPWYDVDTLNDWQMLRGHLAAMRYAGVDPQLPRTEALAKESKSW